MNAVSRLTVRKSMAKLPLGAIVEIPTPFGYAYAQYINRHRGPGNYGPLIKTAIDSVTVLSEKRL
jgi:hypothetical protein